MPALRFRSDAWRTSAPDLLALLASWIVAAERLPAGSRILAEALKQVEEAIPVFGEPDEWLIDGAALCSDVIDRLSPLPDSLPTTVRGAAEAIRQLQRLDRWHEPILPYRTQFVRTDSHHRAAERLFSTTARLNESIDLGRVILGRSSASPHHRSGAAELAGAGSPAGMMLRLLHTTAYLPSTLPAAAPDDEASPTVGREARLHYVLSPASRPSLADPTALLVSIAPLAEDQADLAISVADTPAGGLYYIAPTFGCDRLERAVRTAILDGAHFVFFPEMSVDSTHLDRLREAIFAARAEYFESNRRLPAFRFLFAGVVQKPEVPGGFGRNYLLVLDRDGEILLEQDKLRHWNLNAGCQKRFAVAQRSGTPSSHPLLMEGTRPGEDVTVLDLDGMGRTFALICADMNENAPGDWLLENLRMDWLLAPIMDGSICWTQPGEPPWIIRRAVRAAELSRGRIVVSNSMTLTRWNNDVTGRELAADPAHGFALVDRCGIGLLLDGSDVTVRCQHIAVPVDGHASPVVENRSWAGGWEPMAGAVRA